MTTIYDVARRSGVSPATVSRVLSGRRNVDPNLSEKVRAAVAELGYRPNGVARNLRRASTNLWAVVISDIENPFFTFVACEDYSCRRADVSVETKGCLASSPDQRVWAGVRRLPGRRADCPASAPRPAGARREPG